MGAGRGGVQPALANGAIVVSAERRSGPDCTPGHKQNALGLSAQVLKCVAETCTGTLRGTYLMRMKCAARLLGHLLKRSSHPQSAVYCLEI